MSYTLTALTPSGAKVLAGFEGEPFAAMIDGWAREIAARIGTLRAAAIR